VFGHEHTFPKQVDEVFSRSGDFFNGVFEGCNFAAAAAENIEKAILEGFSFGVLACFSGPCGGECLGTVSNFWKGKCQHERDIYNFVKQTTRQERGMFVSCDGDRQVMRK
jgi:hypothetical protein